VTRIDSETKHEPKLLFPGLKSFYEMAVPLAWPIVRVAVGWNLLVHGWGKVARGPSAYVRAFVEQGFDPALPWIWSALIIEFVGGIALIIGLFTRFFAAAAAVEMLVITFLYWKAGFSWLNRGYEYTLLWGLVSSPSRCGAGGPIRSIAGSAWSFETIQGDRRTSAFSSDLRTLPASFAGMKRTCDASMSPRDVQ